MSYFLSVAKYIFILCLLGNLGCFLACRWTPKPTFKEKHYSEKSIKKQNGVLANHKKMIRNRFILINTVPFGMLFITFAVAIINNNDLKTVWNGFAILAGCFTVLIYAFFFKHASFLSNYDKMPDGSVNFWSCKVSAT